MEHRDEWVSYCSHIHRTGAGDHSCDCAPDLREVVEENERLRNAAAAALERLEVADDASGAADEAEAIMSQVVTLSGEYVPPKEVK